jgi:hypothetical protein
MATAAEGAALSEIVPPDTAVPNPSTTSNRVVASEVVMAGVQPVAHAPVSVVKARLDTTSAVALDGRVVLHAPCWNVVVAVNPYRGPFVADPILTNRHSNPNLAPAA